MNTANYPLFIFEMANNHQGSVAHGLRIIEKMGTIARTHGIPAAVKLQYRDLDTFIHPAHRRSEHAHIRRFLSTRLTAAEYLTLVEAIRSQGMLTVCTPFDEPSVDEILRHGIEIIKVASCSSNDWPLLEAVVAAGKPVICSTGGLRLEETDQVVAFLEHRQVEDFSLLHCVGLYPTPDHAVQLNFMSRMMSRYHRLKIGYSGHEAPDNTDVVACAVAKGARILERHVGVPTDEYKLNAYSLNPEQTSLWVRAALRAATICGAHEGGKQITQEEMDSLLSLRRGAFACEATRAGEALSRNKVFFATPCVTGQTTATEYDERMVASEDYAALAPLRERRQATPVNVMRSIIRQAKGMLHEARIEIGDQYAVEMSHHYGPDKFREHGALIVNLINREYCKKLIIMAPGQRHPNHRHLKKEESFQLLYGDLELTLGDVVYRLKLGQIRVVERGQWHSFRSVEGCIFEEISTTHMMGDSYYEDPAIACLDPIHRKTVLDMW